MFAALKMSWADITDEEMPEEEHAKGEPRRCVTPHPMTLCKVHDDMLILSRVLLWWCAGAVQNVSEW